MDHDRQMAMCEFQTRVRGLRKHVCQLTAGNNTDIECHPIGARIAKQIFQVCVSEWDFELRWRSLPA